MTSDTRKRELIISKGWVQAAVLVFVFGFAVLGWLAYRTYMGEPPIPQRVVDPVGKVLFTGADVMSGQQVFLRNGLMEYGSVLGHGAYLGPDYTADYLRRAALIVRDSYGGADSDRARQQTAAGIGGPTGDRRGRLLCVSRIRRQQRHQNPFDQISTRPHD